MTSTFPCGYVRVSRRLRPQIMSNPLNLAGLLEKQGKPCEALLPIEQMLFNYPQIGNAGGLRRRADALAATESSTGAAVSRRPQCPS